jgi:hypothetical protein
VGHTHLHQHLVHSSKRPKTFYAAVRHAAVKVGLTPGLQGLAPVRQQVSTIVTGPHSRREDLHTRRQGVVNRCLLLPLLLLLLLPLAGDHSSC